VSIDTSTNAYKAVPVVVTSNSANCDSTQPPAAVAQLGEGYSGQQWHLQPASLALENTWLGGNTGQGIAVSVVDDGVELNHEDLAANVLAGLSRNIVDNGKGSLDPSPTTRDNDHGTAVAGLIAAAANGKGMLGIAPNARLVAHNLLAANGSSDLQDAAAMLHANDVVSVVNNSWGNTDGTGELYPDAGSLWRQSVINGATQARCGRGIVYFVAAGNGGSSYERSNYDYLNNHPMVMTIGSINPNGTISDFTEPGSNVLIAAEGSNTTGNSLATTALSQTGNLGNSNQYRNNFAGTSAATPLVSGTAALMLRANPALSWRDIRWILASTARTDLETPKLPAAIGNGNFTYRTGFGRLDSNAAVTMARTFTNLPPLKKCEAAQASNLVIPDTNAEVSDRLVVSNCSINTIEYVELTVSIQNAVSSGDMNVTLDSPTGRNSILATNHTCHGQPGWMPSARRCSVPMNPFTFGSVRHLGENFGTGSWTLRISDTQRTLAPNSMETVTEPVTTLRNWSITVWGH
jgi:subtilisin-like proprotein convertase family protein